MAASAQLRKHDPYSPGSLRGIASVMEEDTQCPFQLFLLGTSSRTCTYMCTHIHTHSLKKHKIANFMLDISVEGGGGAEAGLSALSFFSVVKSKEKSQVWWL